MKSLKTLVSLSALAVCMGAASMASAATITPEGSFTTSAGTIVVTSPSSFGAPVTCGITFGGTVKDGKATITAASLTGGGLCNLPTLKNIPAPGWGLSITSFNAASGLGAGVVNNVGWTVAFPASNCGAGSINVNWNQATHTLTTPSSQSLSGSCAVQSLSVTAPSLTVVP
nr:alkane oxidation protein activator PraB [uncultured Pseudomonas sp.]